jgi:hypothetical protein
MRSMLPLPLKDEKGAASPESAEVARALPDGSTFQFDHRELSAHRGFPYKATSFSIS